MHKARSIKTYFAWCGRALSSTPAQIFGKNWICEPGFITKHQRLTLLVLLWLDDSSKILWEAFPEEQSVIKAYYFPWV